MFIFTLAAQSVLLGVTITVWSVICKDACYVEVKFRMVQLKRAILFRSYAYDLTPGGHIVTTVWGGEQKCCWESRRETRITCQKMLNKLYYYGYLSTSGWRRLMSMR